MKPDKVAMTYLFETTLHEMARDIGPGQLSRINFNNGAFASAAYEQFKTIPKFNEVSDGIATHIKTDGNKKSFYTLDHNNKKLVHMSIIKTIDPTPAIPFKHDVQDLVDRAKSDVLPKGFATNFIYNHFKNSDNPLRSSEEQFPLGHQMWHRLVDRAMNDGHHVYYHDEDTKTTTKLNDANKDEHLEKYFGDTTQHERKHIILSKTELTA